MMMIDDYEKMRRFLTWFITSNSFKCSSTQQDAHSVSYGPIYSKIEDKVEYALGRPVSQDRAVATRIHGTVNI